MQNFKQQGNNIKRCNLKWASSKEIGGGGLTEERIRFKQVGRKFQKYNKQCPTAGMSSDWSEQVNRLEDGESEESPE